MPFVFAAAKTSEEESAMNGTESIQILCGDCTTGIVLPSMSMQRSKIRAVSYSPLPRSSRAPPL